VCPVEDLETIRAELVALFQRQVEALQRDTFVGLTDVERYEYDARHDRIPIFSLDYPVLRDHNPRKFAFPEKHALAPEVCHV